MSRLTDIYTHLTAEGFEVYFPQQKKGECLKPYVVVKDSGTSQLYDFSSTLTLYELLCYVPEKNYTSLETFKEAVKTSMKKLHPMIRYTKYETPPFYDDLVKAHMTSVQYSNARYNP